MSKLNKNSEERINRSYSSTLGFFFSKLKGYLIERKSLIFIFLIGFIVKILIYIFALYQDESGKIYLLNMEGLYSFRNLEGYSDFYGFFMEFVNNLYSRKHPYTSEFGLLYPPLFLYIISMFSFFGQSSLSVSLPLLLCDILTAIVVWEIVYKVWKNNLAASISCLLYMANPLCLFYTDYIWLNTSVFTFFLMISVYFLIDDRYYYSMFFLALSVMSKQFAIVFLPIIIIKYIKKLPKHKSNCIQIKISEVTVQERKKISGGIYDLFKGLFIMFLCFTIPIFILSLPYILPTYPEWPSYIDYILNTGLPPDAIPPSIGFPVDFTVSFYQIGEDLGTNSTYLITRVNFLVEYYILLGSSCIITYLCYALFTEDNDDLDKNTLVISLILFISMTIFFPRGMYKYYCVLFIPIMSILTMNNLKKSGWIWWKTQPKEIILDIISVASMIFWSISIMSIHRHYTPLLLIAVILYYYYYYYGYSFSEKMEEKKEVVKPHKTKEESL